MKYESKPKTENIEYLIFSRNEYDALNDIFKSAIERNYPEMSKHGIPNMDHIVVIGGYYRREFVVNVKD